MRISRMDWAGKAGGVERMTAFFRGHAFTRHRHDTYAVGVTSAGVQSFNYRGAARQSLAGEVFVLHPDEPHDGRAGDGRGFGYRIAYIDPALIAEAAETRTLPFVRDPIGADARVRSAVIDLVADRSGDVDELAATCRLTALADALVRVADDAGAAIRATTGSGGAAVDTLAVRRVREALRARLDEKVPIGELERLSGLSRWQLARQFRIAFGVSPHRYRVLRRLDRARELLAGGQPLSDVALSSGFADQAHFSRQFRSAFGLSPGQLRALAAVSS